MADLLYMARWGYGSFEHRNRRLPLKGTAMLPPIHPGEILAEELEVRGINGSSAARALAIPQSRVSNILRGRTGITADTALRLGRWLGTGPEIWINMQKDYELRIAEQTTGPAIRASVKPLDDRHSPAA
jgi:addiction module HigA family antidote